MTTRKRDVRLTPRYSGQGCSDCDHVWSEKTLREPNFGVAFASIRTCKKCGKRQGSDFTAGRVGGPNIDLPNTDTHMTDALQIADAAPKGTPPYGKPDDVGASFMVPPDLCTHSMHSVPLAEWVDADHYRRLWIYAEGLRKKLNVGCARRDVGTPNHKGGAT